MGYIGEVVAVVWRLDDAIMITMRPVAQSS
jgi:hypothetical protein